MKHNYVLAYMKKIFYNFKSWKRQIIRFNDKFYEIYHT